MVQALQRSDDMSEVRGMWKGLEGIVLWEARLQGMVAPSAPQVNGSLRKKTIKLRCKLTHYQALRHPHRVEVTKLESYDRPPGKRAGLGMPQASINIRLWTCCFSSGANALSCSKIGVCRLLPLPKPVDPEFDPLSAAQIRIHILGMAPTKVGW